jgi:8-oxo-dGTP diphosphatase
VRFEEQGTARARYTVVPRSLCFLVHGEELLLLRGATDKRLWAGKLNGVGGHIETGEDPLASARREVKEETGLVVQELSLRAVVHVGGKTAMPGVILFVFVGSAPSRKVDPSHEGTLAWYPLRALPWDEMVPDLPVLLPRLFGHDASDGILFGFYGEDASGGLAFQFQVSALGLRADT